MSTHYWLHRAFEKNDSSKFIYNLGTTHYTFEESIKLLRKKIIEYGENLVDYTIEPSMIGFSRDEWFIAELENWLPDYHKDWSRPRFFFWDIWNVPIDNWKKIRDKEGKIYTALNKNNAHIEIIWKSGS